MFLILGSVELSVKQFLLYGILKDTVIERQNLFFHYIAEKETKVKRIQR